MRKSKLEAAETRRRIVEVAAQQFRSNGIQATGLNDVMSQAGLTHGGFYRHFHSKNQLVAEACEAGLSEIVDSFEVLASKSEGKEGFKSIVDNYVSSAHRDNAAGGCSLASLGSELARSDDATRKAATEGFNEMVAVLAREIEGQQRGAATSDAVFTLAAMVGAITLSRVISDEKTSDDVLRAVNSRLITILDQHVEYDI
jgi:TetR/AcrR family transcriptional repressor of nem operon